ncbi:MAG: VWA domain-containing protein [Chitinivibrionia bacterium]|nr:VWA domain-containing protein [Chitinivibrionia bacterium]
MVHFAYPHALLLLLLVPLAHIAARLRRRRRRSVAFPSLSLFDGSGLEAHWWKRNLLGILRLGALALVIVAIARPQTGRSEYKTETEGIDIMLVLDISGSMKAQDFKPHNRLHVAKQVVLEFIGKRTHDRIGLVVFAGEAMTQCPLTLDHDILRTLVEDVHFGMLEDRTAIGVALATACNRLKDSTAKSRISHADRRSRIRQQGGSDGSRHRRGNAPDDRRDDRRQVFSGHEQRAAQGDLWPHRRSRTNAHRIDGVRELHGPVLVVRPAGAHAPRPRDIPGSGRAQGGAVMEFARPHMLYALALVPLCAFLLLYGARKRRKNLADVTGGRLLEMLAPGASWRRELLKGMLGIASLACIIAALAVPRFGSQLVKVEREGADLVIALDTSLSMLAEDMKPNRLERAKMEIIDLIRGLRGDRVGIVVFAGSAAPLCPLTVDYDAALMFANTIDVDMVSEPGTAIGAAIERSASMFESSTRKDRAIILVTDGEDHEGNPERQAEIAGEKGIRIFAIGIGNPSGELIPMRGTGGSMEGYKKDNRGETVMTRMDPATLKAIAKASNGAYLPATREGLELTVLYNEIEGMEKKAIKGEFMERKKDRFMFFLAAALLFGLLDLAISARGSTRRLASKRMLHTGAAFALLASIAFLPQEVSAKGINRSKTRAGNEYFKAGAFDKALVLYREALGDSTEQPRGGEGVLYNEGNTLHMLGKYREAMDRFQRSAGAEDSLLAGSVLYNRGNTLMKTGDLQGAVASYVQALRDLPDDPDVLHNLEMALRAIQQQQEQQKQQGDSENQQDEKDRKQEEKQQSEGEQQENQDQKQQSDGQQSKEQDRQERDADSTPAERDAAGADSSAGDRRIDPGQMKQLSKEDALRILQALKEQEDNVQKERKRAAFVKIRRSGKDW